MIDTYPTTYRIYTGTHGPAALADDPKVATAAAKRVHGVRLTTPAVSTRWKATPNLRPPTLTPQPLEKVYAAIEKSIGKSNGGPVMNHRAGELARRTDADGYWLAATDGHRALMRAPDGTARERMPGVAYQGWTPGPVRLTLPEGFAECWQRVTLCAGTASKDRDPRLITLVCGRRMLTCTTRSEYGATSAHETIPIAEHAGGFVARLNPGYVAPVLRCAELEIAVHPQPADDARKGLAPEYPVVFTPPGAVWRLIVMEIRKPKR